MMTTTTKKELKKKRTNKIVTITLAVFAGLLFVLQLTGLVTAKDNHNVQRYGNYQMLTVLTDSMEPTLPVDIGIIIKRVDPSKIKGPSTPDGDDGDIITFFRHSDQRIVTHRVFEIIIEDDGSYVFKAFGDNPFPTFGGCPSVGCNKIDHHDSVKAEDVLGVFVRKSKTLGVLVNFSRNPLSFIIFALIPLLYVFVTSIVDVVKGAKEITTEKTSQLNFDHLDEFEKIKQQEKLRLLIEKEKEELRAQEERKKENGK